MLKLFFVSVLFLITTNSYALEKSDGSTGINRAQQDSQDSNDTASGLPTNLKKPMAERRR